MLGVCLAWLRVGVLGVMGRMESAVGNILLAPWEICPAYYRCIYTPACW